MNRTTTVLVTGATGKIGGQVITQLTTAGVAVRGLSRDPINASSVDDSVEIVGGDLARPDTLVPALDGIDAVFLVFPSVSADAAARPLVETLTAYARRIVYLSANGVPDRPNLHQEPDGGIIGSHAHLEGLIAARATEYTFLRASGFASNTLAWADQIRDSDVVQWFYPDAVRALIHEVDVAAVGVRALLDDGHRGKAYHLTGPEQLTQAEQLTAIGAALGRTLKFQELDAREAAATIFAGMEGEFIDSILEGHRAMVTNPEPVTDTVEQLLGRPALSFAQWAIDHVDNFR